MKEPPKLLHHHFLDYFFPHKRNSYRPHLFSTASVAALVFAVIVFEGAYLVQTKFVFLKTDFLAAVLPGALLTLTNQDRAQSGLAGVTEDTLLDKAAQAAAQDMADKGYFSHVSPDGKTPWYWLSQVGYAYSYAGQNLAVHFSDSSEVQSAWMESVTHRANIVKPEYTRIGFGTANGMYEGKETTFVVAFLATPTSVRVAEIPSKLAVATARADATTTTQVLGSQNVDTGADTSGAAAAAAPTLAAPTPTPAQTGWFAQMLTSPLQTLLAIFTILFTVIAIAFVIALLARVKIQHPSVLIGGTLLLALIGTSMLLSVELVGSPELTPGMQIAAVGAAVLPN